MLIDMHVNATTGDGEPRDARRVIEEVREAGFDGLLVVGTPDDTDQKAWQDAREDGDPIVLFAVPVATPKARFICIPEGDVVGLLPNAWYGAEEEKRPSEGDVLDRLAKQSGAVIVAQPYERGDKPYAGDEVFGFDGIHGVEVRTSHSDPLASDLAIEAGLGMRLPCVAGSGSRRHESEVGTHATLFPGRIETQSDLVAALREGDAWPVLIARPSRSKKSRRRRRRK